MASDTIGPFELDHCTAAAMALDNLLNTTNSAIPLVAPIKIKWNFLSSHLLAIVATDIRSICRLQYILSVSE
jgi:hypothetical protein